MTTPPLLGRSALLLMLTLGLWVRRGEASASYPATLADELTLANPPNCTVCHTSNRGGPGTATTPFARALKAEGLEGRGQRSTLVSALSALEQSDEDTDGDGVSDLDELRAGRSPSLFDDDSQGGAPGNGGGFSGGGALGGNPNGGDSAEPDPPRQPVDQLRGEVRCSVSLAPGPGRDASPIDPLLAYLSWLFGLAALRRRLPRHIPARVPHDGE